MLRLQAAKQMSTSMGGSGGAIVNVSSGTTSPICGVRVCLALNAYANVAL